MSPPEPVGVVARREACPRPSSSCCGPPYPKVVDACRYCNGDGTRMVVTDEPAYTAEQVAAAEKRGCISVTFVGGGDGRGLP